jgi:hypothetical protein
MENKSIKKEIVNIFLQVFITTIGLVIGLFINDYAHKKASERLSNTTLIALQNEFDRNEEEIERVITNYNELATLIKENVGTEKPLLKVLYEDTEKNIAFPNLSKYIIQNTLSSGALYQVDFRILSAIGQISTAYDEGINECQRVMDYFVNAQIQPSPGNIFDIYVQKQSFINLLNNAALNLTQVKAKYDKYHNLLIETM